MKICSSKSRLSTAKQDRKMTEAHAAKYDFDLDSIVAAADAWEKLHPKRMATAEEISGKPQAIEPVSSTS